MKMKGESFLKVHFSLKNGKKRWDKSRKLVSKYESSSTMNTHDDASYSLGSKHFAEMTFLSSTLL